MEKIKGVDFVVVLACFLFISCSESDTDGLKQIKDVVSRDAIRDVILEDKLVSVDDSGYDVVEFDALEDICIPNCEGRQCGDDGCGGSCGKCGEHAECVDSQCKCTKPFENCNGDWSDGCEANISNDPNNCSKCGFVCKAQNVKNRLCEDMICFYDECLIPYIDADLDRTNGCEMYYYWPFRYGTVAQESGKSVIETSDKGFLILGTTNMRGSENDDFIIFRTDSYGNIIWQKILGGDKKDIAVSVIENQDHDYLVGGYSNSFGMGGYDIWLVLLDATGNIKWQKSYGGVNDDKLFAMKPVTDGFVIAGTYNASCATCSAIWVFKIDKNGDFVWQRQFGSTNDSGAFNLDITGNGDILVAGALNTGCQTCYDAIYMRLDSNGNRLLAKQIGAQDNIERGYAIVATSDNGAIVAGEVPVTGSGLDIFLMKFDSNGNVSWQRTYGGSDNQKPYQVIKTIDNGYLLLAETAFYGSGQYDCLLIKMDSSGNAQWQKTYGLEKADRCYSVCSVSDGGYIFAGESYSFDTSLEMLIYKVDRDGKPKGLCPEGLGKDVSLKINNSSLPVRDLNIQSYNSAASTTTTSAYVNISGFNPKLICKDK